MWRMTSLLAKVLRRQKISPTTPMSGRSSCLTGMARKAFFTRASPALSVGQALLVGDALAGDDLAHEVQALQVDPVGLPRLHLVGPGHQQQLQQDVLDHHRPPGRPDELARLLADAGVAVGGGDGEDGHVL